MDDPVVSAGASPRDPLRKHRPAAVERRAEHLAQDIQMRDAKKRHLQGFLQIPEAKGKLLVPVCDDLLGGIEIENRILSEVHQFRVVLMELVTFMEIMETI